MLGGLGKRFCADQSGATAIEYGLLAAMIAVAAIGAFTFFGTSLQNLFGGGVGGAAGTMATATSTIH